MSKELSWTNLRHSESHYSLPVTSLTIASYSITKQNADFFSIKLNYINYQSGRYRTNSFQPRNHVNPIPGKVTRMFGALNFVSVAYFGVPQRCNRVL